MFLFSTCTVNIILSSSVWSKSGGDGGVGKGEVGVVLGLVFVVRMVGVVCVVVVVGVERVGVSGLWVG